MKNLRLFLSLPALFFLTLSLSGFAAAQSQAQMNNQACDDLAAANSEMNRIYKQVLAMANADKIYLGALKNEQRIWVSFRDAQLNAEFPLAPGQNPATVYGSVYPMCRCQTLNRLTKERVKSLNKKLEEAVEGDVCGGTTGDYSQIGQTEVVTFEENGKVIVSAVETLQKPLQITFTDARSREEIGVFDFSAKDADYYIPDDLDSFVSAYLRFKIIEREEFPLPLVFAVASKPGGSNNAFQLKIFGETDGKIKLLTNDFIETNLGGGIHVGALGETRGNGIAVWNYILEDGERPIEPNRYEVQFYRFDEAKKAFIKSAKLVSKNKHESDKQALAELGLSAFVNQLESIPNLTFREDEEGEK